MNHKTWMTLVVVAISITFNSAEACEDAHSGGADRCEELKADGRCGQWKFMEDYCAKTCGFCKLSMKRK